MEIYQQLFDMYKDGYLSKNNYFIAMVLLTN